MFLFPSYPSENKGEKNTKDTLICCRVSDNSTPLVVGWVTTAPPLITGVGDNNSLIRRRQGCCIIQKQSQMTVTINQTSITTKNQLIKLAF